MNLSIKRLLRLVAEKILSLETVAVVLVKKSETNPNIMTTTNNTTTQGNVTNVRLFVLFVLLMLSTTGAFAQTNTTSVVATTSTEVSASKDAATVINTDNAVASSMDFAVWFMGSKKTSNNTSNGTFSKKQLINSGINTNSVLIRSFLKKVSTQENGVA